MKARIIKILLACIVGVGIISEYTNHRYINDKIHKIQMENNEIKDINKELNGVNDKIKGINDELENKNKSLKEENEEIKRENTRLKEEIEDIKNNILLNKIAVELTGYCDCAYCCGIETGTTAMGTHTRVGVIAVPQELELGTNIYIPLLTPYKSDGVFYGEDRGGEIIRKSDGTFILDVWFPTHEQALEFGRRTTFAYIL